MAARERTKVLVLGPPSEPFWAGLAEMVDWTDLTIGVDPQAVEGPLAEAEVVFSWVDAPDLAPYWSRARRLRWLHSALAGVNGLLFPALVESNVVLTRSVGVYADSLAEYALAAMLYFAKRLPEMKEAQRLHEWRRLAPVDLRGATLGVIGLGDVGLAVARRGRSLGMRVVGLRRSRGAPPAGVDEVWPAPALCEMLGRCDYVVVTLPLTPSTRALFGPAELRSLKAGAVLIDIARGGIVDEQTLLSLLESGHLAGAALDVFAHEPLPLESPLWSAPNLLISAHTVDNVAGWQERAVALFLENSRRYRAGKQLLGVVDKARGY
ncbi:MAG: D-2-hydroxyacid dehydrogenase [Chloroflexi bacterium]|nr:D-2-hydroxyacid dehydrogenase [Chloroflexota bacterium]